MGGSEVGASEVGASEVGHSLCLSSYSLLIHIILNRAIVSSPKSFLTELRYAYRLGASTARYVGSVSTRCALRWRKHVRLSPNMCVFQTCASFKDVRLSRHSRQASDEEISNEEIEKSVGLVCLGLT